MTITEAIKVGHSVRSFKHQPIDQAAADNLNKVISECNSESGLNIQLILDAPDCFDTFLAHYGKFRHTAGLCVASAASECI